MEDRYLEAPWVGNPSYGQGSCEYCGKRECECCECGADVDAEPHEHTKTCDQHEEQKDEE